MENKEEKFIMKNQDRKSFLIAGKTFFHPKPKKNFSDVILMRKILFSRKFYVFEQLNFYLRINETLRCNQ